MSDESTIQVNFSRAMPLFPLDAAALLPQQVLPLHIFEDRYRQMVSDALDGAGQIAMGVFQGDRWKQEYHGRPPVRPAVCIGQIVQHERLGDGRYNLLLQGVCRAKILRETPAREGRLYREAMLQPVGIAEIDEDALREVRDWLDDSLASGPLTRFAAAETVLEYVRNREIPTSALLELISFTMTVGVELRYRLLAEGDPIRRAGILRDELEHVARIIRNASGQLGHDLPKGCSWN